MNGARFLAWSLVMSTLTAVGAGCRLRPYEADPAAINARYSLKFAEPCSAWLRSPRTGYKYCSSPAFTVEVPGPAGGPKATATAAFVPLSEGPVDEASLKARGEVVYTSVCATCHQADGKGVAGAFPPLAGSGEFFRDPARHAGIIVNGLQGEIQVQGVTYNGAMPAQGQLTDYDIAAVATYERLSWGNNEGVILPEQVAAVR
jgi:mono/diheme cytochrome c family protein